MAEKQITVTSPLMPSLEEFNVYLEDIWKRKWITNNGYYHKELEKALCEYLGVPYISLFTNGTLPLITALQALRITGEVITTPFSFVATTHSLWWNGIKPVFVDIDPITCNLDPEKIEAAITPRTTAIMPVHVYGNPCDTKRIQDIADKYGLKVIYDAAHAFGVKVNGESVLNAGDMSTLSFHATKVYNTIEGGALVMHDEGKIMGKDLNRALRDGDGEIYDIIAGDFLVVGLGEEDFSSLSPELMKQFEEHFHQPETFVRMGRSIMALPLPDDMVKKEDAPIKADPTPRKSSPDRDAL